MQSRRLLSRNHTETKALKVIGASSPQPHYREVRPNLQNLQVPGPVAYFYTMCDDYKWIQQMVP